MSIQEQVKKDMIEAMKNKDVDKTSLLKVLIGEFNRIGKDISDEKTIKEIRSMSENAKEMKNQFEVDVLKEYLPNMLDEEDVKDVVKSIIKDNNATSMKDMGVVMGSLKKHQKSTQINMKIANKIVREILS